MDTQQIYLFVALALAQTTISVTSSSAKVFEFHRDWIAKRSSWLGDLVTCFYCTSHWVAFALVGIYGLRIVSRQPIIDYFVTAFALVAVSAILGGIITKLIPFGKKKIDILTEEVARMQKVLETARKRIVEQDAELKKFRG